MARHMAVQRNLAWPSIQIRGERLAKERLRCRNAAVTAQEKVDRLSLLVDRSIEVVSFASNGMYVSSVRHEVPTGREYRFQRFSYSGTYRVTRRRIVL